MAPRWFCNLAGSELGPLSPSQLKKLAATGRLRKDDFVRKGTDGEWVRARRVKGLFRIQEEQANAEEHASESTTLPVVDTREAKKPTTVAAARPMPMRPNQGRGNSASASPTATQWRVEKDRAARRRTMYLLAGFLAIVSVGLFVVLFPPTSTPQRNVSRNAKDASPQAVDPDLDLDLDLDLANEVPENSDVASMNGVDDAPENAGEPGRDARENDPFAGAIDASTRGSVALGAVRAFVESVLLGPPRLERAPGRFARPSNSYLVVRLGLRSSDDAKRVDYNGWSNFQSVSLSDELGNKYPQKRFRGASVVGQVDRAGLYSDKPLTDVLVFERPVPRARRLRLELPGIAIGETGSVAFSIPVEMIGELTTDSDSPPAPRPAAANRGATRTIPARPFDPSKDPDGDVSKILQDIDALGGGDAAGKTLTDFGEDEDRETAEQADTQGDEK